MRVGVPCMCAAVLRRKQAVWMGVLVACVFGRAGTLTGHAEGLLEVLLEREADILTQRERAAPSEGRAARSEWRDAVAWAGSRAWRLWHAALRQRAPRDRAAQVWTILYLVDTVDRCIDSETRGANRGRPLRIVSGMGVLIGRRAGLHTQGRDSAIEEVRENHSCRISDRVREARYVRFSADSPEAVSQLVRCAARRARGEYG